MKITHSGPGLEAMEKALKELASRGVEVGFQEDKQYPDGTPIAYVAAIQEFGPYARPFFRPTMEAKKLEWGVNVARGAIAVANGKIGVDAMLQQVGMSAAGDIQKAIIAVTAPPLKDSTIAARARRNAAGQASTKPLVDTGQMLRAVDSVVVDV